MHPWQAGARSSRTGEFLSWHINCLELRAVFLALINFLPFLKGCHVIFRTDNMAVVSHINLTVTHPKQACMPSPPLVSGQVPLLESGSCSGSLEPRSRFSVETEAQVRGMDVEPSNSSPDLGFVRQGGSGPLCVTGFVPIPALVLLEFPGTSGHRRTCSPLAREETVRVSASQADSGSPVQSEGKRCLSPTRSRSGHPRRGSRSWFFFYIGSPGRFRSGRTCSLSLRARSGTLNPKSGSCEYGPSKATGFDF